MAQPYWSVRRGVCWLTHPPTRSPTYPPTHLFTLSLTYHGTAELGAQREDYAERRQPDHRQQAIAEDAGHLKRREQSPRQET